MMRRYVWFGFFVLCLALGIRAVHAEEELTSLLRARGGGGGDGGTNKVLRKYQAQDRLTELQRMLTGESNQKHQQRLSTELEKLDKLITTYQLPMGGKVKWWLRGNKDIKHLRSVIASRARRLRGLTFQLQTVYSSIQQNIQAEQQALKRYLRALKVMSKLVTKQFPLKRIGELRKVMKILRERIKKQKQERRQSEAKIKKLNKQLVENRKKLQELRKEMFQEPPPPQVQKKEEEPPSKNRRRRRRRPRQPSQAELQKQERQREIEQSVAQLKSLDQRLKFSYLTQQALLFSLRRRDEKLHQAKIDVDIQLLRLTLSEMRDLYKFHAAKLEGGNLHYEPFVVNNKLFQDVSNTTRDIIQQSPKESVKILGQFTKEFTAQRKKWGTIWFVLLFILLPLAMLIFSFILKRWLVQWIKRSDARIRESQATKKLRRFLLLLARFTRDIMHYAMGFAVFSLLVNMLPLPAPWQTMLVLMAGMLVAVRAVYSLANQLFAVDPAQRYFAGLDDFNAQKFRVFLKFMVLFSLPYWPTYQAIKLLNYPKTFIDLFQLLFFALALGWLLFSFFKPSTLRRVFSPPPEMKALPRLLAYRIYPILLLNLAASFVVYMAGYRNLASYLATGLSMTVVIVSLAYGVFQLLSLVLFWFFSVDEDTPVMRTFSVNVKAQTVRLIRALLGLALGLVAIGLILEVWEVPKGWRGIIIVLDYPILHFQKSQLSLLSFVKFFLVFGGTLWASRWIRDKLSKFVYPALGVETGTQHAINTVLGYLFLMVGLLTALQVMGMSLGVLTVFAGAVGIGVGFGLRDIASNFISGLILIFGRPVSVGDVIQVGKTRGVIRSISARSTTIETATKHTILIPNAKLVTSQVENLSKGPPFIRVSVKIGVAYGSDLDLVRQTLMEIAKENPKTIPEPEPVVNISDFADNNIVFTVVMSTREYLLQGGVKNWVRNTVAQRFKELGIQMAFPQTDLHLDPEVEQTFSVIKDYLLQQKPLPIFGSGATTATEPEERTPPQTPSPAQELSPQTLSSTTTKVTEEAATSSSLPQSPAPESSQRKWKHTASFRKFASNDEPTSENHEKDPNKR